MVQGSWFIAPKIYGIFCDKGDKDIFCYVNEAAFRKPIDSLEWGAGCQLNQPLDFKVGNFNPTSGRGEGLEIESANADNLVNHDHVAKSP